MLVDIAASELPILSDVCLYLAEHLMAVLRNAVTARDREMFHIKPSTSALAMTFLTPPGISSCYNDKRDTLSGHAEVGRSGA
jgi:hypothetical protein